MSTKVRLRKVFGCIGKILSGLFILLLGLILIGLIRESIIRNRFHAQYPAPGKMVTINDHDIHLHCVGHGKPTVIFEADLDQYGSLSWHSVLGEIGRFTRACSYDRAGIMWSEPGPLPRDGETIATELKNILDNAGEEGPYVLVGHAFGGAYARIFAGQNPNNVCGLVLVDSSHPEMLTRFAEFGIQQEIPDQQIRPLILLLSYLGMPGRFKGNLYNLSPEVYEPTQAFLPESSLAWFDEQVEGPDTLSQAGQYETLGDIPLIVLASARPSIQVKGQNLQDVWLKLQRELLLLSSNSEIRIFEDAGHYIQLENPELVIKAIQDVLEICGEN